MFYLAFAALTHGIVLPCQCKWGLHLVPVCHWFPVWALLEGMPFRLQQGTLGLVATLEPSESCCA